ncbi:TPA: hypothetical protein ACN7MX_002066 [Klebsiella pneumoniae]|uniref:hypothetical protein n=1 Tax=Klebsiella pneumoniae TaxID=573 RepID=UPI0013EFC54C|nr:hypothetical protein [Klebsiella pneumoniae]QIH82720.1 hypothetical protein EJB54_17850 [Klebsiella pneumoniae]HBZ0105032.1 hypothetical protein [Klebsiella pneumoniae]HCJ2830374.1 hypothetical protein [Klebsiella pneumoniae]
MTRDDMIFDVNYSFHLEKMYFTVLTRIDKAITMLLIVLGFSVFAPFTNLFLFGVTVAFLSVIQLVYQFGQAAGLSKEQMRQYRRLLVELSSLTDEELREKYIKIQDADSIPWQSLQEAAFKRTCISLGRNCEINLSLRKRVIAWIAGDMP